MHLYTQISESLSSSFFFLTLFQIVGRLDVLQRGELGFLFVQMIDISRSQALTQSQGRGGAD